MLETANEDRSTILLPGIATSVHAGIALPAVSFTVRVAEVNTDAVVTVKFRHAWMAFADEHAIRGSTSPPSKTTVAAGTAQLPAAPVIPS